MSKHANGDNKATNNQGEAIITLLSLPRTGYGRVDTIIGDKTAVGLVKTIQRILDDPDFAKEVRANG